MSPLRVALVGEKIGYSRSPEIFAAIFRILQIEGRFEAHSVSLRQLSGCVEALVRGGCSGFAVTIPHKQAIFELVNERDASADAVGAINSVAVRRGIMIGYNTDADGFAYSLRRCGFSGARRAVILGSGGAARAVIHALSRDFGVVRFGVLGRSRDRVAALIRHFGSSERRLEFEVFGTGGELDRSKLEGSLIVNCTPVGGPNHGGETLLPENLDWEGVSLFVDLNYNRDNRILCSAGRAGTPTLDGSDMLVAQAIRSFELWTGLTAGFDPVYESVFSDH